MWFEFDFYWEFFFHVKLGSQASICKSYNICLSISLFVRQIITHEPLDWYVLWILNGELLGTMQRRIQGRAMGAKPPHPWTSEIYWFQGVFRPQRELSTPPQEREKKLIPPGQIPVYAPGIMEIFLVWSGGKKILFWLYSV